VKKSGGLHEKVGKASEKSGGLHEKVGRAA
jgi:hypothetical protein